MDDNWSRPSAVHVRSGSARLSALRGSAVTALPSETVARALWAVQGHRGSDRLLGYTCLLMYELSRAVPSRGRGASTSRRVAETALTGLFAVLDVNEKAPLQAVSDELLDTVSLVLSAMEPSSPRSWRDMEDIVEPLLFPDSAPKSSVLVVAPCSDRTPAQRDALTAECHEIGARAEAEGMRVTYSDQKLHLPRDRRDIAAEDKSLLRHSDMVFFVLDGSSTGVGVLIGHAHHHRAIVALVAPPQDQVQIGPTVLGMVLPHNALRAPTMRERLDKVSDFVRHRRPNAVTRMHMRRERRAQYGPPLRLLRTVIEGNGGLKELVLPAWFAQARLAEILADEQGYATAVPEELEVLSASLAIPTATLLPDSFGHLVVESGLSEHRLRLAGEAAVIRGWDIVTYNQVLTAAVEHSREQTLTTESGLYVRADVDLDRDAEAWIEFGDRVLTS